MAEDLTVRSEVRGDAVMLRFDGDIDLVTAPVVNKSIKAALEQSPTVLVVDLSGVEFMASAGLAELANGISWPRNTRRFEWSRRAGQSRVRWRWWG